MTGAVVMPTGVEVIAAVCREDPGASFVKLAVDLPGLPDSLALSLDPETATALVTSFFLQEF